MLNVLNEHLIATVKYTMMGADEVRTIKAEQLTADGIAEAIKQLNIEIDRLNLLSHTAGE